MKSSVISSLSLLFLSLAVVFGMYLGKLPLTQEQTIEQVAQVISSVSTENLALSGTPIASVTSPEGFGGYGLNILKDGIKPSISSEDFTEQYDTYTLDSKSQDWFGYTFPSTKIFNRLVFQEGVSFPSDGGWFSGIPEVQVRQSGVWVKVVNMTISPSYPGDYNGVNFETYTFNFDSISGDAIRIVGIPGGIDTYTSIAELEVYGPGNVESTTQSTTVVTEQVATVPPPVTQTSVPTEVNPQQSEGVFSVPTKLGEGAPSVFSQSSSVKFTIGESVQTNVVLKVRETATIGGLVLGTQRAFATGKIVSGPILNGGMQWWKVDYTNSPDGWSAENYLTKYTGTPTVQQALSIPLPSKLTKELSLESSGAEVKVLQNYLIRKAYLVRGANTGYFGYSTSNAVKAYQRAHGIRATGVVGPQTRTKINADL